MKNCEKIGEITRKLGVIMRKNRRNNEKIGEIMRNRRNYEKIGEITRK